MPFMHRYYDNDALDAFFMVRDTQSMELFFSPLACSVAVRIVLYEANATVDFVEVDRRDKRTVDGRDFTQIHPLGLVPALRTDDGVVLTETLAIFQHLADRFPEARLLPTDARSRVVALEWLAFASSELHKVIFGVLLDENANDGARALALHKSGRRLDYLAHKLADRSYALDSFSAVDAYLLTILNWARATPIDLSRWPSLSAYVARHRARPSVRRAFDEELPLYRARPLPTHG